ncbi:MAG: hypothetical protein ACRC62_10765 [Microcoleus sp.]
MLVRTKYHSRVHCDRIVASHNNSIGALYLKYRNRRSTIDPQLSTVSSK